MARSCRWARRRPSSTDLLDQIGGRGRAGACLQAAPLSRLSWAAREARDRAQCLPDRRFIEVRAPPRCKLDPLNHETRLPMRVAPRHRYRDSNPGFRTENSTKTVSWGRLSCEVL